MEWYTVASIWSVMPQKSQIIFSTAVRISYPAQTASQHKEDFNNLPWCITESSGNGGLISTTCYGVLQKYEELGTHFKNFGTGERLIHTSSSGHSTFSTQWIIRIYSQPVTMSQVTPIFKKYMSSTIHYEGPCSEQDESSSHHYNLSSNIHLNTVLFV